MDIVISKNVQMPMRDGTPLAADIYRAAGAGPQPTVLIRVPYDKEMVTSTSEVARFVGAGYVVAVQDVRGRFASGGEFTPFLTERADGEDTVRWLAGQEFCDGTVAMAGASYFGATQWLAAAGDSPALKAMAPNITASSYYEGWTYQGGAFQLGFVLCWTLGMLALGGVGRAIEGGRCPPSAFGDLVGELDDIDAAYRRTPLTSVGVLAELAPYYRDWLAHPTDDGYWQATAPRERYSAIEVPSLNIGGWYDCFLGGTLANYSGLKEQRGDAGRARSPRLIIGPWSHGMSLGEFASGSFGVLANSMVADLTGCQVRFFDRHVRGIDNGLDDEPPVRVFVMGVNAWRDEADWPLPDTRFTEFYLHSGGAANSAAGDGGLTTVPPADEPTDTFVYDPHDPVPTVGGQTFLPAFVLAANAGPRDRRPVEARPDVLCYSTAPLDRDTEVTGPVSLVLHVSSSAVDTDFTAGLVDVHPDGPAVVLTEGILRVRYRDSTRRAVLMTPGECYELTIDLWATANVFRAGHRIRLEVSSSNFPRFDRNSNTGGVIAEEFEHDYRSATNRVHHDAARPSRLVLPIIDRP